jgi:hypothetical protein|tara:strand:+ start:4791 stop:5522 length:732 start_codon:yes stop_codon:yes gene_type:complete
VKAPDYWGVAGNPIEHSLTPRIFEIVGNYLDIEGPKAIFIEAWDIESFKRSIMGLNGDIWLSITTPIKHEINKIIINKKTDENISSTNQIMRKEGEIYGINTDGEGFIDAVKYIGINIKNTILSIKGGGSTAISIAHSWSKYGGKIIKTEGRRKLANGPWDKSIITDGVEDLILDLDLEPGALVHNNSKKYLSITYNESSGIDDFGVIMVVSQHLKAWEGIFAVGEAHRLPSIRYVLEHLFND